MSKEAMKLALEALETLHDENMDYLTRNKLGGENNQCMVFAREAITALREALASQQEPVAWICYGSNNKHDIDFFEDEIADLAVGTMLYTQAQRPWVGLTDEEVEQACVPLGAAMLSFTEVSRAIEAKLREKNT